MGKKVVFVSLIICILLFSTLAVVIAGNGNGNGNNGNNCNNGNNNGNGNNLGRNDKTIHKHITKMIDKKAIRDSGLRQLKIAYQQSHNSQMPQNIQDRLGGVQ